jgi:hypothetical protein
MPLTADEIQGLEHDWLATDADGHVAVFSTAGGGYAPDAYLQDPDAYDTAISTIAELPIVGSPVLAPKPGDIWATAAERGLFGFDGDLHGRPYKRVAIPKSPTHITQLPHSLAAVAGRLVLSEIRFADAAEVSGDELRREALLWLLGQAKAGTIDKADVRRVASYLRRNPHDPDAYTLLHIVGSSFSIEHRDLVEQFLTAEWDPMLARLALQIVCSFWNETSRYLEHVRAASWPSVGPGRLC